MKGAFEPKKIEKKWYAFWESNKLFSPDDKSKKEPFCIMIPPPNVTGSLHMGHGFQNTLMDVLARYKRAKGFNVMHPMGWDAFGLPAENAAIENKISPAKWTYENISTMRSQLQSMGLSIDWDREVATCDKEYYHQQHPFHYFLTLVHSHSSLESSCTSEHDQIALPAV